MIAVFCMKSVITVSEGEKARSCHMDILFSDTETNNHSHLHSHLVGNLEYAADLIHMYLDCWGKAQNL